ncbi:MAG: Trp family transcriptional regulator [Candidatus Paceibacterota bacterium]
MHWNLTSKDRLLTAIRFAEEYKFLEKFLLELLTKKEMRLLSNRLEIMCLLYDGASYKQIEKTFSYSSATVAKLAKIVNNKESHFHMVMTMFKDRGHKRHPDD